jgi:hypothetical protein
VRACEPWHARREAAMLGWVLVWSVGLEAPAATAPALDWDAPTTCPSAAAMRDKIAALAPTGARPRAARVVVVADATGFHAVVEIDHAGGWESRELTASSCETLADAAALVIAIGPTDARGDAPLPPAPVTIVPPTIDTPAATRPPAHEPAAQDDRATQAVPRAAAAAPAPRRRTDLRIGIAFDAGITWPNLVEVAPTLAGAIAVIGSSWRVELRAIGTTRTDKVLSEPPDSVTAELRSTLASIRAAWVPHIRTLELPLAGGVELGGVRARPQGGTNQSDATAFWLGLTAGAGLAWVPRPWLAIRAELSGLVALVQPSFGVRVVPDREVIWTAPRLGLRALAGVELRLAPRSRSSRR